VTVLTQVSDEDLAVARRQLTKVLSDVDAFTPGTFQETRVRCGKPACHCASDGDPGHGPVYAVVRYEKGKTVTRRVPAAMADEMRGRVAAWSQFQDACARLAEVNAEESRRLLLRTACHSRVK